MAKKKKEIEKDKLIKKEINKLKSFFKDIEKDRMKLIEQVINQVAFMTVTLDELKEKVNKEGAIITIINGNGFKTIGENPAQKTFNTTIKNYNASMKLLIDMLPAENDKDIANELAEFAMKYKK